MKSIDDIVQELIPGYLAARKEEVPEMMRLLASSEFERLRILSHSLKGSGRSFGFSELTRFGASLEKYAEASDGPSFAAELERLKQYLAALQWSPKIKTDT